jgi:hypothetical protein
LTQQFDRVYDLAVCIEGTYFKEHLVSMVIEWDIIESLDFFFVLYAMIIIDNQDGWTALLSAAGKGHEPVVATLLANKANVNNTNKVSH